MVGGAAGWTIYFILMGQGLDQAVQSTKRLYKEMEWGEMLVHNDDNHGHITDLQELSQRTSGCGFLSVLGKVGAVIQELLQAEGLVKKDALFLNGEEIFSRLVQVGAKIVPLTGNHKIDEARVVINQRKGKTLNRDEIYKDSPTFLWDAWATTNSSVLERFNKISGARLTEDQFFKLQAVTHLTTGILLGAVKLGNDSNVIMIH